MVLPSSSPTTYPAGTLIAERYRIEAVLGIGGFGAVYKCIQLNMNQTVAVKVLKMEHITSEEHVRRFEREARAASKLRHPNTISIFDFGTHVDGALYLAMEYLEGETLADRLDGGPLSPEQLVHIMSQVAHSLTEAHEANLVHRDLKPENIMLMSVAGDPNFVKVLDFGIAKVDDEYTAREEKLTEMGMIMGTPQYMSPEQAYGYKLDPRSDIYALGVLMYEALTSRVPFEGDKPMEILLKHINTPPARPTIIDPDLVLPLALEKAVLQCLEKKPDDRPQTTRELVALLDKALKTPDDQLRRRSDSDDEGDEPAVTTHVAGLAGTPAARAGASERSSGRASAADTRAHSSGSALWVGLAAFALIAIVAVAIALVSPGPAASTGDAARETGAQNPRGATGSAASQPEPSAAQAVGVANEARVPAGSPVGDKAKSAQVGNVPVASATPAPATALPAGANVAPIGAQAAQTEPAKSDEPSTTAPAPAAVGGARVDKAARPVAHPRSDSRKTHTDAREKKAPNARGGTTDSDDDPPSKPAKPPSRDDFRLGD